MRILIVRVSSLGDVVHNLPVLADIHLHFPDAIVDWVVEEPYMGLITQNKYVNEVIPFNLRKWKKNFFSVQTRSEFQVFSNRLKEHDYDYVFDTQGLLKSGIVMGLSHTSANGQKVGLALKTDGSSYEPISRIFHDKSIRVDKHIHVVQRSRELIGKTLGYEVNTAPDFGLRIPIETPKWLPNAPYAIFFHGTSRESKKWAHQNWVAVADLLNQVGLNIALPWGSESEKNAAELLAKEIDKAVVLPRLSITDMVTLTGRSDFVVGVDTGLTHLAAAFDKPTVQIYCNIPRWRTCADWSDKIISLGGEKMVPTLPEVIQAIESLLPKRK